MLDNLKTTARAADSFAAEKLAEDGRALTMGQGLTAILAIAVILIVASAIVPDALTDAGGVNTTYFDSGAASLWPLVSLFGVIAVIAVMARAAGFSF